MTLVAIETLNAWASAWAGAMGRSLVESTALLAVVALAWLLLRRRASSAFLHGLFLLVLIKAAVPVALPYTLDVSLPSPRTLTRTIEPIAPENLMIEARAVPSERLASLPVAGPGLSVTSRPRPSLAAWLMLAWAVVVARLLARLVSAHFRMARGLRGARLIDSDELPVDPAHLAALAGLWRSVPIVETNCVAAPAIWGLVRPRLLVPPGLIETLPNEQLTWVFLHELVHVRRGDSWVLLFQRLIQIVFFFNPAVWVANRVADVLREFACDDASLVLAGVEPHECGAGFLAIAERACRTRPTPAPIALGLFGSNALIHKRLERILDADRPLSPRLSWRAVMLLGMAAVAVLPSVRAQAPAPEPSKTTTAGQVAPSSTVDPKIRTLELVAVDGKTKTPLKDAVVTALVDGASTKGTTDGNGRCILKISVREPRSAKVQVRKDGYVIASVEWNHGGEVASLLPAAYTLPMEPGTKIGGLVEDSAGQPIAGVLVHVISKGKGGDADIREHSHKSDAQGHWQCSEVPADLSKTWYRFEHPKFARMTLDPLQPTIKHLDREDSRSAIMDMMRTESELIDAESKLAILEAVLRSSQEENGQQGPPADGELKLIEEEFMKDPQVAGLIGEIAEIRNQLEHIKEMGKRADHDPAAIELRKREVKLSDQYERLWETKFTQILQRLRGGADDDHSRFGVTELRKKVAALKAKKEKQMKNFGKSQSKIKE